MTLVALVALAALLAPPSLPSVNEVTRRLDDLYRSKSSHAVFTMEVVTRHYRRTLELEAWSLGKDLSLVVIRKPAREAGTATLRTEEGLWNYAPRADRLVRIPPALLSERWMGSHFTNDDLVRESSWEEDFTAEVQWAAGQEGRRIELVATPKPNAAVVWSKVVFLLSFPDLLPLEARYYDKEEVARRMTFSDVRRFGDRRVPARMEVVPTDHPEERTTVTYRSIEFDVDVPRSLFTPAGLRRAARQR